MKKLVFSAALFFGAISAANAQCGTELACANGSTINLTATAANSGSHSVCLSNSLCGSEGLRVRVKVNGHVVYNNADWDNGDGNPTFNASNGDVITVTAESRRTNPDIVCVWAGEINACIGANM